MPTQTTWKKWAAVVTIVGVCFTMLGSLLGVSLNILRDRASLDVRLVQADQAQKNAADRINTIDGRLNQNDQRWERLETRLDPMQADIAAVKAIVERMDKRDGSGRPAKNQLDGAQQQGQQDTALSESNRVR